MTPDPWLALCDVLIAWAALQARAGLAPERCPAAPLPLEPEHRKWEQPLTVHAYLATAKRIHSM